MRHEIKIVVTDKLNGHEVQFDLDTETEHQVPMGNSHVEAVSAAMIAAGNEYSLRCSGPPVEECVDIKSISVSHIRY